MRIFIMLTMLLIFMAGVILLQLFLSKRHNKWLGLILPIFTFAFSILFVMNIRDTANLIQIIILIISTLLICNIPTIILLAIYSVCRKNIKRKCQIEKMNIQDL